MDIELTGLPRHIEKQIISFEGPDQLAIKTVPTLEHYQQELRRTGNEAYQEGYQTMVNMAKAIREHGGMGLLVGGAVRDMAQGVMVKDFDLEVYDVEADALSAIAEQFGKVSEVGKAFGILKVAIPSGLDLDLSLPRRDSKTGEGHKGFAVKTDPSMLITEACRRRDFTINAMAADPISGKVYDPFNGWEDLQNGILRVVDPQTFVEDPLRVMRAMQFAGRFRLEPDAQSMQVMRELAPQLAELPKERLLEEWKKLLLKSERPSVGLQLAMDAGVLAAVHPEFLPLASTEQDPKWHPEGDVFTHTKLAIDQAAKITKQQRLSGNEALVLMLGTLCHDLGKPLATHHQENRAITAYGHDEAGVAPTMQFLEALGVDTITKEKVAKLVEHHMWPHNTFNTFQRGQEVSDGAFRKLATKLAPATMTELALLTQADATGTGFYTDETQRLVSPVHFAEGDWLRQRSAALNIEQGKPQTLICGQDLIDRGLIPGKAFGEIITMADQLRDEYGFTREQVLETMHDAMDTSDVAKKLFQLKDSLSQAE